MFGNLLHRMIFRELIRVFVLSLLSITGILLMAGIIAEASQQGFGPGQIMAIIPLLVPSTMPYTIPATTLFAACVVYGRLSADNEILALRASGISMSKVVWPGLLFGLMTSGATLGLYYHVIPYTHHLMRSMFLSDVEELLYTMLRKNNQINYQHLDYQIYVKSVQGRKLVNPVFKRRNTKGEIDVVAVAREAELRVDMNRKLIMVNMRFGEVWSKGGATSEFVDHLFEVPLPENMMANSYRRARDMTWQELSEFEDNLRQEEKENQAEIDATQSLIRSGQANEDRQLHFRHLHLKHRLIRSQILGIIAERQMRPALALGCFFFVLVGCPVGIWFSRSDYLSSFITCFLPIVVVYYPLLLCGTSMAKDGRYDPWLTIWAADALIGIVGLALFRRLLKN